MKLNTNSIIKQCKPIYLLLAFVLLCSHDLYIKMDSYFLKPNQEATLSLYNGTFENSENIITRDRMLDASLVAQGKRTAIDPSNWKDQDSIITQLTFKTGEAGTYVAGVSTKARNIELTAEKFNSYLKNDGVLDMLQKRTTDSLLNEDAVESYQKHVKAIYQVGDVKTNDWNTVLGYPIEFVPQENPYDKYNGDTLEVQLLLDGKPLPNQLVFADFIKNSHGHTHDDESNEHEHDGQKHSHEHSTNTHKHAQEEKEHSHTSGQQLRTDAKGIVTVKLPEEGVYYLRTINMTRATDSDELTHRSKWATLTFEVSHAHGANSHTHEHDTESEIPTWLFVLGSFIIIGILVLIFRKKDN
ncbi:DUF4198 domain-containing protein [Kordia algicida OT-1]|nr:DUF4198 domain-containing protein [Kordia algicida]